MMVGPSTIAKAAVVASPTANSSQLRPRRKARASPVRVANPIEMRPALPPKLAAVALANKTARIAWKLLTTGESYDGARMPVASKLAA